MVRSIRRWRSCFRVPIVLHRIFSVKRYKKQHASLISWSGIGLLQCFGKDFLSERRFLLREYKSYPVAREVSTVYDANPSFEGHWFPPTASTQIRVSVCSLANKRSTIKRCSVTMWIAFEKKLRLVVRLDPGLNILGYRMQKLLSDLRKDIERIVVRIFKGSEKFSNFIASGYDRKDFAEDVPGMGIALIITWKFS